MGARRSYNPKNKGKKSFQPILTFIAETREFVGGELRNGDRPTGKQIARHLESVMSSVPNGVQVIYGRADCSFYCWEAVHTYEKYGCQFIVVAKKTTRLLEQLKADALEAVAAHRRRRTMRVLVSADGMGARLSVHRPTL
jgi:hypothetical protein